MSDNNSLEIKNNILYIDGVPSVGLEEKRLQEFFVNQFISTNDRVLEMGYGLGFASEAISLHSPDEHIIIEIHEGLSAKAVSENSDAIVINKDWREVDEMIFSRVNKVLYDSNPDNPNLLGKDLALNHLRPIAVDLIPRLKKGTVVGVIDPSASLSATELKKLFGENNTVSIVECPTEIVPKGLPWFKDGCNFVYIEVVS